MNFEITPQESAQRAAQGEYIRHLVGLKYELNFSENLLYTQDYLESGHFLSCGVASSRIAELWFCWTHSGKET